MKRRIAGILACALVLLADQLSKALALGPLDLQNGAVVKAGPMLNLVLVWNHGITFGMFAGAGGRFVFATVASLAVLALLAWMWRAQSWVVTIAVGAIAGGAVGNVIDRVRFGAVVDFLQAHFGALYYPWVFNVGDSAIVCGVLVLMLENLLARPPVAQDSGER
ncbi:signal peptidase II [Acidocella sp.]|uniref:signal peptidase II n=1 Tax=Acidocella sp. TaxID=50710 RepID=UPI00260E16F4|nr:signal peptidase II [Acidocella sp.]